ncbi:MULTISPECIES: hypothetical protein [unclassified Archaeoglobus]|jgi:hypothetical protein|nr:MULTISPECIES: hypothetical protein [unclassified Archaeoglobus]
MRGRRKKELIKKLGEPELEYLEEERIRKWLLEKLKCKYGSKVF